MRPTVKLLVSNVEAKSSNLTWSPTKGADGNVIVIAPPEVSTKYLSFAAIVILDDVDCQGLPPPKPVHCVPL